MCAANERVLALGNGEYITVIEAGPGASADDEVPDSPVWHTNIIASEEFGRFTFISRLRSWQEQKRGTVQYQRFSFEREPFRQGLDNEDEILRNINAIGYQRSTPPIERFREGSKRAPTYVGNLI